jgi:hypothetical protein
MVLHGYPAHGFRKKGKGQNVNDDEDDEADGHSCYLLVP